MAFIVPTGNSTLTAILSANDTFYLGAGLRITQSGAAVGQAVATSNNIRVSIDGNVSASLSGAGTINLLGTSNSTSTGIGNNSVSIGQTGSVTNLAGSGVLLAGTFGLVDNAGSIQAQESGVRIQGANAKVTNAGSIEGALNAITVLGTGALIDNSGNLRANATAVDATGNDTSLINSGQISSLSGGVRFSGQNCEIANSGTVASQSTAAFISGNAADILNSGTVISQSRGLQITGVDGSITNDGAITARADAIVLFSDNGVARNNGQVSGSVGILANALDCRVENTGDIAGKNVGILSIGSGNSVRNTATGHVTNSQGSFGAITIQISTSQTGTVANAGLAEGERTALLVTSNGSAVGTTATVVNTGTLTGGLETVVLNVASVQMTNSGTIDGGPVALRNGLALSTLTLVNKGVITTETAGIAVALQGNTGVETLRNTGTVNGDVLLDAGNDRVTNDGLIRGTVDMGADADAYNGLLGRLTGVLLGGAGNDTLTGGTAGDVINGGTENDMVAGAGGADRLFGAAGNDTLSGGDGADFLAGATGRDVLTGGVGTDVFVFTSAATAGIGAGRDQITDFVHLVDDFEMIFMASFIGNAAFTAAGQVRYVQATGLLTGSTDGDAAAEWALLLVNKPVIAAGDFVF